MSDKYVVYKRDNNEIAVTVVSSTQYYLSHEYTVKSVYLKTNKKGVDPVTGKQIVEDILVDTYVKALKMVNYDNTVEYSVIVNVYKTVDIDGVTTYEVKRKNIMHNKLHYNPSAIKIYELLESLYESANEIDNREILSIIKHY